MNITRRGLVAAAAGSALAAGCASVKLAQAGAYRVENSFTVRLARPWSDMTAMLMPKPKGVHLLTIDGPALNQLYLASLDPGTPLFRQADRDTPVVTYRADMTDIELVEFVIDSVAQTYQEPQSSGLRPQSLAGAAGVRFDITARTTAGLNMSGAAVVARANDKLNLIIFLAPTEHYFGVYAGEVDAMFASATA